MYYITMAVSTGRLYVQNQEAMDFEKGQGIVRQVSAPFEDVNTAYEILRVLETGKTAAEARHVEQMDLMEESERRELVAYERLYR